MPHALIKVGLVAAAALALLPTFAVSADPQPRYRLKTDVTGSRIQDTIASSTRYPLDRAYPRFTDQEKAALRAEYENMPDTDDPPFPESGLRPIVTALSHLIRHHQLNGEVSIAVTVNVSGEATEFSLLKYPDIETAKSVAYVLSKTKYKPAMCAGQPCVMQWLFRTRLESR